jgi:starvation-inducible DNA-binding protein
MKATAISSNVPIELGIEDNKRKKVAEGLCSLLADAYTLYLKTQNFHWNVTGPLFESLHKMFEVQYTELAESVDLVAERIRALGFFAPATFKKFSQLASIKEEAEIPNAEEMVRLLVEGHEAASRAARELFDIAEDARDQATADLLTGRMEAHEKTAWMLRSILSQGQEEVN